MLTRNAYIASTLCNLGAIEAQRTCSRRQASRGKVILVAMKTIRTSLLAIFAVAASTVVADQPKNVILMIADGTGFNSFAGASMAEGRLGKEVFDGAGWVHYAVATYPLNLSSKPTMTGKQDPEVVYDPAKAWSAKKADGKWSYPWLTRTPTDSAAAATAMATGVKTYNNSICLSDYGSPLTNIHQVFKAAGKSTGVVTSVPWTHATPAGMAAHNKSRNNYAQIGREMIEESGLDVIMGAGHPWFDGDGNRIKKAGNADYVGGWPSFVKLEEGLTPFRLVQTKSEFAQLATGRLDMKGKRRVLGVAQVADTLQQGRRTKDWNGDGKIDGEDRKVAPINGDPRVQGVPKLETMVRGALGVLEKNPKGFFLMVEGGAVDWANHANQPARMVEEASEFFRSVEAVSAWVETHGGWSKNLVIVTADHETGTLFGPKDASNPFPPLIDRGTGHLPGMEYRSGGHSNSLVPIIARGKGSERIASMAVKRDPRRGPYIENTDIFRLMAGK